MTQAEAKAITRDLLDTHDLHAWRISFTQTKRKAGVCNYTSQTIQLSKYLLAQRSYESSLNTITHEVAHALTRGHNHDAVWAAKHRELGGDGKRTYDHVDDTSPWVGVCPHGQEFSRYRKPKHMDGWSCQHPGAGTIVWKRREELVATG